MKKFIISVLCVAVFFLGIGSLVQNVGAKFKSDARALELIAKARLALGGDEAINAVKSLAVKGKTTITFDVNGTLRTEQGDAEIALQLPNQLMRTMKIGQAETGSEIKVIESDVVIAMKADEANQSTAGGKKVNVKVEGAGTSEEKVIIKKADGTVEEVKVQGTSDVKEIVTNDGTKIIVKKIDGANGNVIVKGDQKIVTENITPEGQEITTADGKKIIVRKVDNGNAVFVGKDGKTINLDGKKVLFTEDAGTEDIRPRHNELLRLTLSLLLSSPQGINVSYTFAGEENVGGTVCNAINAEFGGEIFKIFLDATTNLPVAMNYSGMKMLKVIKIEKGGMSGEPKDIKTFTKNMDAPETANFQVKFSDFRGVNGVQFPHRWETSANGNVQEIFDVTNFEVNPTNIGDKFKAVPKERMMMRVKKTN